METVIKNSKLKPLILLLISLFFLGLCFWIIIENQGRNFVGYVGFIFFLTGIIFIILRLKKGGGIEINDKGLIVDINNPTDSFVAWKEIKKFSLQENNGTKIINIHLYDPQKFTDNQQIKKRRKEMERNLILFDAPIGISVNLLDITYKKLEALLMDNFNQVNNLNIQTK